MKSLHALLSVLLFIALMVGLVWLGLSDGHAASYKAKDRCEQYRSIVNTELRRYYNDDTQAARFLAQLDAESACKTHARSPVGAVGLAQFMPFTWKDMKRWYPRQLSRCTPNIAECAIRAQVLYMKRLEAYVRRVIKPESDCAKIAMATAGYNAGVGWIRKESRKCDLITGCNGQLYFNNTQTMCVRRTSACKETRHYVKRILSVRQIAYILANNVMVCGQHN